MARFLARLGLARGLALALVLRLGSCLVSFLGSAYVRLALWLVCGSWLILWLNSFLVSPIERENGFLRFAYLSFYFFVTL